MTPQEALEESVSQLIEVIEKQYKTLLNKSGTTGNAYTKHIFLTEVIDLMHAAPPSIDGIMRDALLLRLYLMRSDISTDAEFIKVIHEL